MLSITSIAIPLLLSVATSLQQTSVASSQGTEVIAGDQRLSFVSFESADMQTNPLPHPTMAPLVSAYPTFSMFPTRFFSHFPTGPTQIPVVGSPSGSPTSRPNIAESGLQSASPSSSVPSVSPSTAQSSKPTGCPSEVPSASPSWLPSSAPSRRPVPPTGQPSELPTSVPSVQPSSVPSVSPSSAPSSKPTVCPSEVPSASPSWLPSSSPSRRPVPPTGQPSELPTSVPSVQPSSVPSVTPSLGSTGLSFSSLPSSIIFQNLSIFPSQQFTHLPSLPLTSIQLASYSPTGSNVSESLSIAEAKFSSTNGITVAEIIGITVVVVVLLLVAVAVAYYFGRRGGNKPDMAASAMYSSEGSESSGEDAIAV